MNGTLTGFECSMKSPNLQDVTSLLKEKKLKSDNELLKCPSPQEMAGNMTVDEAVDTMWPQRFEMLAWLNETLQTRFTKIEQVCTGAAYCQLMDCLFPGSLDLSRVRFQSSNMVDSIHNYSLLQAAFREVEVKRHVPVEALIVKNKVVALTFLLWFKTLFDKNNNGRKYHALEARGGQSMVSDSDAHSAQSSHQKLEIILKMKEPRKEKPRETSNRHAEVIVLTSDDEDDVVDVTMEQKTDKMETMEIKRMEQAAVEERKQWSSFNDNWLPFIRRYCSDTSADPPHSFSPPQRHRAGLLSGAVLPLPVCGGGARRRAEHECCVDWLL
ncbi:Microtubule-associated protein RP/EB family member 3 [Larimichthys crocea]|uniref:Uncharacterized protein n=1 Tax=Larimichthys crocea TaxID=215358 RepID=A0ACD3RC47_LARCR|nr:Microtubule-associated protein RP/EB family member 3 [Larimichthys crocea]